MKFLEAFRENKEKDELIRKLTLKCKTQAAWIDARMRKEGIGYDNPLKNTIAHWQRKAEKLRQEMPEVFDKYFARKKGESA